MDHRRNVSALDARRIEIRFSPKVQQAYRDLAAAVHFSGHFDPDTYEVLRRWSGDETLALHDVLIAFPLVAAETFLHIQATGDERAKEAWENVCSYMPENGFTLAKGVRGNQRA